ncbi:MAG TPA: hypothetical protein VE465_07280 [Streptosporangiaceae bacterium]|jgi:hypothetical protein|nr:hypothetical protein [Streptosporangiaceae bacterium]
MVPTTSGFSPFSAAAKRKTFTKETTHPHSGRLRRLPRRISWVVDAASTRNRKPPTCSAEPTDIESFSSRANEGGPAASHAALSSAMKSRRAAWARLASDMNEYRSILGGHGSTASSRG